MKLLVEIPDEVERRLRESLLRNDQDAFHEAVRENVAPLLEVALRESSLPPPMSVEEYRRITKEMEEAFHKQFPQGLPELPPEALTREGIYGEHP